jgi:hypothetical protein
LVERIKSYYETKSYWIENDEFLFVDVMRNERILAIEYCISDIEKTY